MSAAAIFKKLRFDDSKKSIIINAPKEYTALLKGMKYDKEYKAANKESYDFVQIFASSQAELENLVKKNTKAAKYDCVFWLCYPKGGGKIKSDIKRDTVWLAFELADLQAVTQVAIDETWSALRGRPPEMVGK